MQIHLIESIMVHLMLSATLHFHSLKLPPPLHISNVTLLNWKVLRATSIEAKFSKHFMFVVFQLKTFNFQPDTRPKPHRWRDQNDSLSFSKHTLNNSNENEQIESGIRPNAKPQNDSFGGFRTSNAHNIWNVPRSLLNYWLPKMFMIHFDSIIRSH